MSLKSEEFDRARFFAAILLQADVIDEGAHERITKLLDAGERAEDEQLQRDIEAMPEPLRKVLSGLIRQ